MQKFDKWFLPDGEKHLPEWMANVNKRVDGRLTYQYGKYEIALQHIKKNRLAIDVGAHVGLLSYFMARDFEALVAFEPMREHAACWEKNMQDWPLAELWPYALGDKEGTVSIACRTAGSSGDTGVTAQTGDIPMRPLDFFELTDVDFIKIDCEGYEEFILRGAAETLERCKPCVMVEQKGTMSKQYGCKQKSAVDFLEGMGAKLRAEISGDFILSWDE